MMRCVKGDTGLSGKNMSINKETGFGRIDTMPNHTISPIRKLALFCVRAGLSRSVWKKMCGAALSTTDKPLRVLAMASNAVLILSLAFGASSQPSDTVLLSKVFEGGNSDHQVISKMERYLSRDSGNILFRATLVGYYGNRISYDVSSLTPFAENICWFIENAPRSTVLSYPFEYEQMGKDEALYRKIGSLWLKVANANPKDLAILMNASLYFSVLNPPIAEKLLLGAVKSAPKDYHVYERLGLLYSCSPASNDRRTWKKKAVKAYRKSYQLAHGSDRYLVAAHYAGALLNVADNRAAETVVMRTIREMEFCTSYIECGDARHRLYSLMGRIALRRDNPEMATYYLFKSIEDFRPPLLSSFGPELQLARDMLIIGRKREVLRYLYLLKSRWAKRGKVLETYIKSVKETGKFPD